MGIDAGDPGSACRNCAAPLATDQRYCLHCGQRRGDPRVDFLAELGLPGGGAAAGPTIPPWADAPPTPPPPGRSGSGRPSRLVTVALAAVTLGVGSAAGALLHGADPVAAAPPAVIALEEPAAAPAPATTSPDAGADADAASADAGGSDDANVSDDALVSADPLTTAATPNTTTSEDVTGSPTPASTDEAPTAAPTPAASTSTLPKVGHVWLISLTGQDAASAFGPTSTSTYLSKELPAQGALLSSVTPVAPGPLANDVALLSGQGPDTGPLYPADVQTLAGQLTAAGKTWRAYLQGLPNPCDPATPPIDAEAYAADRNPFGSFAALLDPNGSGCVPGATDLTNLAADLPAPPTLSWIVPGTAYAGPEADPWLRLVVSTIQATAAYKKDGLIVITFDAGPPLAPDAIAPATPAPLAALLLSPVVRPGTKVATATDPYVVLRTLEDLWDLPHLGHADDATATSLGANVFTPAATTPTTTGLRHGGLLAAHPLP